MKRVLIQDDDEDLFNVPLHPILYHYYKENSKEIRRMVKQQGVGFWIQFVTSFRSFISNSGLDRTGRRESYEEAFIDMLKILTTEDSFTEFISLVESLKTLHMMLGSLHGYFMMGAHIMQAQVLSGFNKPLHTFPIYLRFVGAVIVLYQRWKHAPKIRARTPPATWIPPGHWSQQNGHGPRLYECYLYDRWGKVLHRMIHMDKEVMKFFNPQEGGNSTSASSSKNQNSTSNVNTTQQKRNKKRRRRNRNDKNKNGGITKPSAIPNEAVLVNETYLPCAKEDMSGVEHSIAGGSSNEQGGTVSQQRKQEVKDKQKGRVHSPAETERTTNTGATRRTTQDGSFRYDRLFTFSKRKRTDENTSKLDENDVVNNDVKTKQGKENMPRHEDKEPASCRSRSSDSFRYDRLFNFGKNANNSHNGSVDVNDELAANSTVGGGKKKGVVHPTDKQFATKRDTSSKSKEKDFFRYDRLFDFHTPKQNAPQNANKRAETNETEEKNFFRYDRLFNFSTQKQKATEYTDEASISSDDSYQYELDDYTDFHDFCRGSFRKPFQHAAHKKKMSQPIRKYLVQKCSNCNILEKYPGMYQECKRCLAEGVQAPKLYCGEHCGRTHWRKQHRADHRKFGYKHTTFRK